MAKLFFPFYISPTGQMAMQVEQQPWEAQA
jgi:hypothetical protein